MNSMRFAHARYVRGVNQFLAFCSHQVRSRCEINSLRSVHTRYVQGVKSVPCVLFTPGTFAV